MISVLIASVKVSLVFFKTYSCGCGSLGFTLCDAKLYGEMNKIGSSLYVKLLSYLGLNIGNRFIADV